MAYSMINAILAKYAAGFTAAEAHGMATGMLCADSKIDNNQWLNELLEANSAIEDDQKKLLKRLFEETRQLLIGEDDFEFDLLLPDNEDTSLLEKVTALKNWCQGFLFGIGSLAHQASYSRDAHEILKDISEFTKLDTDVEEDEEDEVALMELTEYLRSAVLLLRDELQPNK